MSSLYLNRVAIFAHECPYCQEQASAVWLILHQPGCPAGEDIEPDEGDTEGEEEEPT